MEIELHPEARVELVEESFWYEQKVPGLGESFIGEFESALSLLARHPELGTDVDELFRSQPLRRFPHSLIYIPEESRLQVVAVAHQRRKPGYWRARVGA